jgi:hypothetical protein
LVVVVNNPSRVYAQERFAPFFTRVFLAGFGVVVVGYVGGCFFFEGRDRMYYDMRCGSREKVRLGLDELKQELANVLEGQAGDASPPAVVVARSGCLPAEKKASRGRKRRS